MQVMSPATIENFKVKVPNFVESVKSASADTIILMLDAFAGEPALLYDSIWYATKAGKSVEFVPDEEQG